MFQSVLRRPICDIGVTTARHQCRRLIRWTVRDGGETAEKIPWLSRTIGLLSFWFQGASVDAGRAAKSGLKRKGLLSIFADHCSFVTGQRLRRACQIGELYSNLYTERTRRTLVNSIWRRLQSKHAPTGKLFASMAAIFLWDKEKIQDEEIQRFAVSSDMHVHFQHLLRRIYRTPCTDQSVPVSLLKVWTGTEGSRGCQKPRRIFREARWPARTRLGSRGGEEGL